MNRYIPLILAGVLLNAAAQVCIKQGMRTIGAFRFSLDNVLPIGSQVLLQPFVLTGVACYGISLVLWLLVLSRVPVSYAYPFLSIGYIVAAAAGRAFFGETLGFYRWGGILVICLGVYLITRSA